MTGQARNQSSGEVLQLGFLRKGWTSQQGRILVRGELGPQSRRVIGQLALEGDYARPSQRWVCPA